MTTPSMAEDNGFDWGSLILLGNDIALQWYTATQDKPMPTPQYIPGTTVPTSTVNNTILMLGLVAVAAILLLRK